MSKIVVIGDVHGKTEQYQKMLRQKYADDRTIQCGDMGIGFKGVGLHKMPDNHKWFRGNHDNPAKCREHYNYMGDYGYLPEDRLFWLAGAASIDRVFRVEGISWWSDEELTWTELEKVIELYAKSKPKYVVSHECPREANNWLLIDMMGSYFAAKGDLQNSRTCCAMQAMLETHQPEKWVFGHYHIFKEFKIPRFDTEFICVPELGTYVLETK
jgi:predicted phosphohydrolase